LSKLKVGLIGAGLQGKRRANSIIENKDELLIIGDINIKSANALSKQYSCEATTDWETVIRDDRLDAIVISTPNHLHAPIAISAAKNNKHIFCEKPIALNSVEAKKVIDTIKDHNIIFKCGFTLRHHPSIKMAKKLVDNGELGRLMSFRCVYGNCSRKNFHTEWRTKKRVSGGGELLDQGIHVIDLLRWFGEDWNQVVGYTNTLYWNIEVEDNAFALLRNNQNQVAMFHVSWSEWKNIFLFEIIGEEKYIKISGLGGSYGTETIKIGNKDFLKPFGEKVIEFRGDNKPFLNEWLDFTESIHNNKEPLGNAHDAWMAMKIADCIYKSNNLGKVMNI